MTNRVYDNMNKTILETEIKEINIKDNLFHYEFKNTVFYAKSGGMESDIGYINGIKVLEVYKMDNKVIHVLDKKISNPVLMEVDYKTRLEHASVHTAQHLISALFQNNYNAETRSFNAGYEFSTLELELEELNDEMIANINLEANKLIREDLKIKIEYPTDIKSKYSETRAVIIGDIDYNLCGCIHVPSLRYIGKICIFDYEKTPYGYNLKFVSGDQVVRYVYDKYQILDQMKNDLKSPINELNTAVLKVIEDKQNIEKELDSLKEKYFKELIKNINTKFYMFDLNIKDFQYLASIYQKEINKPFCFLTHYDNNVHIICYNLENNLDLFNELKEKFNLKGGGNKTKAQGGGEFNEEIIKFLQDVDK